MLSDSVAVPNIFLFHRLRRPIPSNPSSDPIFASSDSCSVTTAVQRGDSTSFRGWRRSISFDSMPVLLAERVHPETVLIPH